MALRIRRPVCGYFMTTNPFNVLQSMASRVPMVSNWSMLPLASIHTCSKLNCIDYGAKRDPINFRDFPLANKVGQYDIQHTPDNILLKHYNYPLCEDTFGQKYPGYWIRDRYVPLERGGGRVGRLRFYYVKEMEPEIIVPKDVDDCRLKPYVTYKSSYVSYKSSVETEEFTARSLFDVIYREKIQSILSNTDLSEDEKTDAMKEFTEVNDESIHEARIRAQQTGSDLFVKRGWYGIGRERDDNWN